MDDRAGHRPFGRRSGACARSQSCNLGQRSRTISDNLASPRLPSPPLASPRPPSPPPACVHLRSTEWHPPALCTRLSAVQLSLCVSAASFSHSFSPSFFSPSKVSEWCICDDYGFESHCFVKARGSREAAERQPRGSRDSSRCSRDAVEMQPRCSRDAAEMQPRCSRGAAEIDSPSSLGQGGRTWRAHTSRLPAASRPPLGPPRRCVRGRRW